MGRPTSTVAGSSSWLMHAGEPSMSEDIRDQQHQAPQQQHKWRLDELKLQPVTVRAAQSNPGLESSGISTSKLILVITFSLLEIYLSSLQSK